MVGKHNEIIGRAWDQAYSADKYIFDKPIKFTQDIIDFTKEYMPASSKGLYAGCGNGRNFIPLVEAGLKLDGIDLSGEGIDQIRHNLPSGFNGKLMVGDFHELSGQWDYLLALQVLHFGDKATTQKHFAQASSLIRPGGYLFFRVPSAGTAIDKPHEIIEGEVSTSRTVRYNDHEIYHYFEDQELQELAEITGFTEVTPLRDDVAASKSPKIRGTFRHFEAIWQKV